MSLGEFFLFFWPWLLESRFFDVKLGFSAKNYPRNRILRFGIENPVPQTVKDIFQSFLHPFMELHHEPHPGKPWKPSKTSKTKNKVRQPRQTLFLASFGEIFGTVWRSLGEVFGWKKTMKKTTKDIICLILYYFFLLSLSPRPRSP